MMLELRSVTKSFGALSVITDVTLSVHDGEVVGVLGPNGAGKSTLFNLINGNVRTTSGSIVYEGRDIGRVAPWNRCRMGIGRTFQIPKPFRSLSVFENVLVGAVHGNGRSVSEGRSLAIAALDLAELSHRAETLAGDLGLLDLKRLELAKALAVQPKLLLLDEIAGGLTDAECDTLLNIIGKVHREGATVIWVEHVIHALTRIATRLVVLGEGRIIASGTPDQVLRDRRVLEIYMGEMEL
ncbi:ABC transporter ATP-binding protein [Paraburkholderia dipogonis]|uniref:ABC transporter ATP-binding protein n=1 Tax=Paraburkholderia dipogonis TaxID=1211383 RepID=A0A4Y8MGI5_9BURK|nr:ABC transporter ATP-binding protein [Paraburkholderia dipogonis]TFE36504.1 ABC transporter ATP-binding protein [Paraburkholderia dipogonis]